MPSTSSSSASFSNSQGSGAFNTGSAGTSHEVDVGAITGGAVGGVVALVALGLGAWLVQRRRSSRERGTFEVDEPSDIVTAQDAAWLEQHPVTPFAVQKTSETCSVSSSCRNSNYAFQQTTRRHVHTRNTRCYDIRTRPPAWAPRTEARVLRQSRQQARARHCIMRLQSCLMSMSQHGRRTPGASMVLDYLCHQRTAASGSLNEDESAK